MRLMVEEMLRELKTRLDEEKSLRKKLKLQQAIELLEYLE